MPSPEISFAYLIDAFPRQENNCDDLHLPVGCTLLYLEVPR